MMCTQSGSKTCAVKTHQLLITMKSLPLNAILALAFVGAVTTFTSGCANTAKHESTGQYVDDSTITTKVKAAFAGDDIVHVFDVHVETYQGVVQLSGFVDIPEQKARAEMLAKNVAGVQSVKNDIAIK
jgi:hyperosmotically inducible protein